MQVILEAIKFNHEPKSATTDAFNIRRNETEVVNVPEWRRGVSVKPEDSPAAYARDELQGRTPTIRAKFSFLDFDTAIQKIRIRAVDGRLTPKLNANESSKLLVELLKPVLREALSDKVLGTVMERDVRVKGGEEFELFNLDHVNIASAGVSVSDIIWRWQFRTDSTDWTDFATTTHRIFTTLALPAAPWQPKSLEESNTQLPWAEVLDYACRWAVEATDIREAAFQITKSINLLGPAFVRYDKENNGGPHFTPDDPPSFDCQKLLNLLKSGSPQYHGLVNCDDCAAMVCTFANVLGCTFPESNIGSPKSAQFSLRRHKKIGLEWENFDQFDNHVIAWSGADQDEVSDACLTLDADDSNSSEPKPLIASKMPFAGEDGYRRRLVVAGEKCELRQKFFRQVGLVAQPVGLSMTKSTRDALLPVDAFSRISNIGDWTRIEFRYVPNNMIEMYLQLAEGPNKPVLRLDIQVATTEKAANDNLMRQLARFELPNVRPKEDPAFEGKVFADDSGVVILFSRNQFICLLRNVGRTVVPLWDVAPIVDKLLRSLPNL